MFHVIRNSHVDILYCFVSKTITWNFYENHNKPTVTITNIKVSALKISQLIFRCFILYLRKRKVDFPGQFPGSTRLVYAQFATTLTEPTYTRIICEFRSANNHAESSCKWEDPPENGLNFRPCAVGICLGTRGSYSKNSTRRITRCDPHYVLARGYEHDVCNNGVWSSRGHECVRKSTDKHLEHECGYTEWWGPKQTFILTNNVTLGDIVKNEPTIY